MKRTRPGPVPLSRRNNEAITTFKFNLTESQRDFVYRRAAMRGMSASRYMRKVINIMMYCEGEKEIGGSIEQAAMQGVYALKDALWEWVLEAESRVRILDER